MEVNSRSMMNFNLRLTRLIRSKRSHLCVGLDINPEAFKQDNVSLPDLKVHTAKVIEATYDLATSYKPNLAFFERWGSAGFRWLEETMELFDDNVVVIGDAKRGDIGNTAAQYVYSLFNHFGFDAVTINPYMGRDSIEPFIDNPEKGVFILCRTSNPSAGDIQDLESNGKTVFEKIASLGLSLNGKKNVGLVVGATAANEISRVRDAAPGLPFLIPGVGAQGGDLELSLREGNRAGVALINVSRGISFAGDMSVKAIRSVALEYVNKMRDIMDES